MEIYKRFSLLSPLDHRYYFANKDLFEKLSLYLSEEASIRYVIKVEISLLKHIAQYMNIDDKLIQQAIESARSITPEEIHEEEEITHHNIRAVVNVLKRHVPKEISQYIHLGATSFDITDTAFSMRLRDVTFKVIIPLLITLEEHLIEKTESYNDVVQVGRTHGQYAVPITMGHTFSEYVSRLGNSIQKLYHQTTMLTGKLSGAVGAYNALSLIVKDPIAFEQQHIKELRLITAEYSNQICAPEPVLRLLLEYNVIFGIVANLADDLRNLQRSEIGEVYEHFGHTQVGSSTMPQKRNPWNSEHIKSLYKVYCPRVITFFQDQISEHQRDLTNSASLRFIAEYIAGFAAAINRATVVIKGLQIDKNRIAHNLQNVGNTILAEAAYILLALSGYDNAHEILRKISTDIQNSERNMIDILKKDSNIWTSIERHLEICSLPNAEIFFSAPEHYVGQARKRSLDIVYTHKEYIKKIRKKLEEDTILNDTP